MSNDCEQIVQAVAHVKTRWQLSQPVSQRALIIVVVVVSTRDSHVFVSSLFQDSSTATSKKIKPKDVPGTLLNMVRH